MTRLFQMYYHTHTHTPTLHTHTSPLDEYARVGTGQIQRPTTALSDVPLVLELWSRQESRRETQRLRDGRGGHMRLERLAVLFSKKKAWI